MGTRSLSRCRNVGEPRTVRRIYFLPNDPPYRPEMVDSMKVVIRRVQNFFAEQMQANSLLIGAPPRLGLKAARCLNGDKSHF